VLSCLFAFAVVFVKAGPLSSLASSQAFARMVFSWPDLFESTARLIENRMASAPELLLPQALDLARKIAINKNHGIIGACARQKCEFRFTDENTPGVQQKREGARGDIQGDGGPRES